MAYLPQNSITIDHHFPMAIAKNGVPLDPPNQVASQQQD